MKTSDPVSAQLQAEISDAFSILEETSFIYSVYRDVRRAIVHRFPYLVWYRIIGEQVIVLACSQQGRILKSRGLACVNVKKRLSGPENLVTLESRDSMQSLLTHAIQCKLKPSVRAASCNKC